MSNKKYEMENKIKLFKRSFKFIFRDDVVDVVAMPPIGKRCNLWVGVRQVFCHMAFDYEAQVQRVKKEPSIVMQIFNTTDYLGRKSSKLMINIDDLQWWIKEKIHKEKSPRHIQRKIYSYEQFFKFELIQFVKKWKISPLGSISQYG